MSTALDSRRHGALEARVDTTHVSRRHLAVAAVLVVAAAALRVEPLGASSLWLDDAWVALASRIDSVGDLRLVGLTAPGFALLLGGWLAVTGGSALAAQLLPFAFAVVAPGLLHLVAVRRGAPVPVAGVAGALLATSPLAITFASRVKQYPLDALLAVVLLALGWWVAERPDLGRRWVWLTWVGVAAMILTAAVVPVVLAAFAAAGLAAWRDGGGARRHAVLASLRFALLGGAWWVAVLRPAMTDALRTYWAGHYVDVGGGLVGAVADVPRVIGDVLAAASPLPVWASALLLAVGVGWLAVRRPVVAVLVATPLLTGLVLAALQLAPFGGGRTDHYLFPGLALGMAFALEPVWHARRSVAVSAAAVGAVVLLIAAPPPHLYPEQDVRPLVAELEAQLAGNDKVVVYPSAVWAYALYTGFPVDVVDAPESVWRWRPDIRDPRVEVIEPHRDEPERYAAEVSDAVADADGAVWLIASHIRSDLADIEEALAANGFEVVERWQRPGARLSRWERAG